MLTLSGKESLHAADGVWAPVDPAGGDAVHSVAVSGNAVLGGTYYNGLYRIDVGGTTQPPSAAAPIAAIARNPTSPSSLAAGAWFEGVLTSADGGVTWAPDAGGLAAVDVYSLAWAGSDLFAGTSAGAFYRAAGGWEARSSGLAAHNVLALLALPPVPPDPAWTLVAGTEHGLFHSTDKGLSWSAAGAVPGDVPVHSLEWAGRPAVIVAGSERGIYRSADAGLSWAAAAGPGAVPVSSLAAAHVLVPAMATVPGVFFAGTAGGAFISEDGGLTWSAFGSGLAGEARKVLSLAVACGSVITVYAGTGDGIWQNSFDPPTGNADCDGDGFTAVAEEGSPLCENGVNDDSLDDTVANDGCPGGPPQAGSFSEAQFHIGTSDQDSCGASGWPLDIVGTSISANKLDILDLGSFIAPVRRFDTSPGDPAFDPRWDLIPGTAIGGSWINILDLGAYITGTTGNPPMLLGARAFNQKCQYPP